MDQQRIARIGAIVGFGVLAVAGCKPSHATIPKDFEGIYHRGAAAHEPREATRLVITQTHMTVHPAVTDGGPTPTPTDVQFKSVSCDIETCKFADADDRCVGTIVRRPGVSVSVTATGACSASLSGDWSNP